MYRVALVAALAVSLGACSLNTGGNHLWLCGAGIAGSSTITGSSRAAQRHSLGALDHGLRPGLEAPTATSSSRRSRPTRLPKEHSRRRLHGALADRDYTGTALNPERARDLINQYRHEKGLKPLRAQCRSSPAAAKAHSRDLAKWDRISHYGSDGSNPWDRVKRAGYRAQARGRERRHRPGVVRRSADAAGRKAPATTRTCCSATRSEMGLALVQDPKTEFKSFWTLVIGSSM